MVSRNREAAVRDIVDDDAEPSTNRMHIRFTTTTIDPHTHSRHCNHTYYGGINFSLAAYAAATRALIHSCGLKQVDPARIQLAKGGHCMASSTWENL